MSDDWSADLLTFSMSKDHFCTCLCIEVRWVITHDRLSRNLFHSFRHISEVMARQGRVQRLLLAVQNSILNYSPPLISSAIGAESRQEMMGLQALSATTIPAALPKPVFHHHQCRIPMQPTLLITLVMSFMALVSPPSFTIAVNTSTAAVGNQHTKCKL